MYKLQFITYDDQIIDVSISDEKIITFKYLEKVINDTTDRIIPIFEKFHSKTIAYLQKFILLPIETLSIFNEDVDNFDKQNIEFTVAEKELYEEFIYNDIIEGNAMYIMDIIKLGDLLTQDRLINNGASWLYLFFVRYQDDFETITQICPERGSYDQKELDVYYSRLEKTEKVLDKRGNRDKIPVIDSFKIASKSESKKYSVE